MLGFDRRILGESPPTHGGVTSYAEDALAFFQRGVGGGADDGAGDVETRGAGGAVQHAVADEVGDELGDFVVDWVEGSCGDADEVVVF